jgi:CheY-like chemotaxis protein
MQGDQVAAELRRANPRLQIVYMSGYGERLIAEPSQRVMYLPKPFSAEDLLAAVAKSLAESKTGLEVV